MTTSEELSALTKAAAEAAPVLARASDAERAAWLNAVADALDAHRDELVEIADRETHLGAVRLTGEVGRTTGQLRLFASAVLDGAYLEAIIDHAAPDATPPRPDLRRLLIPLGPVAVFSASNFPFAFSVAGGDTASALAVGCPVIVKAHSGHIELSRRTAEIVTEALVGAGAPAGTFALVEGREIGLALVADPAIKAAGFTGSLGGGRALFDIASRRPDPIPFYGELGSINPVVITQAAASGRAAALAEGLAGSFTMGSGQFCTKPGIVFVPSGSSFEADLAASVASKSSGQLLTDRIQAAFPEGLSSLLSNDEVSVLAGDPAQTGVGVGSSPVVLATTAAAIAAKPESLLEECFGPTTLIASYSDDAELFAALESIEGSLTATIHCEDGDDVTALLELLGNRSGRVLFNGWPTGVAVTWSQNHGGPWPATTSIHTSVGATATRRFLRPLTFQDAPASVLPAALLEENPLGIQRRVDGVLTTS